MGTDRAGMSSPVRELVDERRAELWHGSRLSGRSALTARAPRRGTLSSS
jgi:hypothetical protein